MHQSKIFPIVILLSLLCSYSCKNDPKSTAGENTTTEQVVFNPAFEKKTASQKIGDCDTEEGCLEITAQYPYLIGVAPEIQNKINQSILSEVIETMEIGDTSGISTLEASVQLWVDTYKEYLSEDIGERLTMSYELEGSGYIKDNIAVTELPVYTYTGGAHPNHYTNLSNYNLNTGELIEMEDIIVDSTAFKKIMEKAFYESIANLGEEASDKDMYFWGKGFYLPANFAIRDTGLYFIYNPYEIAAYVLGAQEFTISYADLKGVIKLP